MTGVSDMWSVQRAYGGMAMWHLKFYVDLTMDQKYLIAPFCLLLKRLRPTSGKVCEDFNFYIKSWTLANVSQFVLLCSKLFVLCQCMLLWTGDNIKNPQTSKASKQPIWYKQRSTEAVNIMVVIRLPHHSHESLWQISKNCENQPK